MHGYAGFMSHVQMLIKLLLVCPLTLSLCLPFSLSLSLSLSLSPFSLASAIFSKCRKSHVFPHHWWTYLAFLSLQCWKSITKATPALAPKGGSSFMDKNKRGERGCDER